MLDVFCYKDRQRARSSTLIRVGPSYPGQPDGPSRALRRRPQRPRIRRRTRARLQDTLQQEPARKLSLRTAHHRRTRSPRPHPRLNNPPPNPQSPPPALRRAHRRRDLQTPPTPTPTPPTPTPALRTPRLRAPPTRRCSCEPALLRPTPHTSRTRPPPPTANELTANPTAPATTGHNHPAIRPPKPETQYWPLWPKYAGGYAGYA